MKKSRSKKSNRINPELANMISLVCGLAAAALIMLNWNVIC